MKTCFTLLLLLMYCKITSAQTHVLDAKPESKTPIRICTPSRANLIGQEPLYVVKTHGKEIRSKFLRFNDLDPRFIKHMDVLKDSLVVKKYGQVAKYGVVEITLDDEKYPDAYKMIRIDSVKTKN